MDDDPVRIPITGELDLHTFRPSEISSLLPAYFAECRELHILSVRVIHGKGSGSLRLGVHHLLNHLPGIQSWHWPATPNDGGWGATRVHLLPECAEHVGVSESSKIQNQ